MDKSDDEKLNRVLETLRSGGMSPREGCEQLLKEIHSRLIHIESRSRTTRRKLDELHTAIQASTRLIDRKLDDGVRTLRQLLWVVAALGLAAIWRL